MNNFRFYFDCYTKARKKTIIVLCIIGIPLSTLAGSPFLWYAMEYQAQKKRKSGEKLYIIDKKEQFFCLFVHLLCDTDFFILYKPEKIYWGKEF